MCKECQMFPTSDTVYPCLFGIPSKKRIELIFEYLCEEMKSRDGRDWLEIVGGVEDSKSGKYITDILGASNASRNDADFEKLLPPEVIKLLADIKKG